jgi:hypothetical protein
MSLGADPARVMRMVLADGGVMLGIGIRCGLVVDRSGAAAPGPVRRAAAGSVTFLAVALRWPSWGWARARARAARRAVDRWSPCGQ